MIDLAADWLRQAGVEISNAAIKLEISPLFALDASELRAKVQGLSRIDKDTYFGPEV